jgi:hypothetical protein
VSTRTTQPTCQFGPRHSRGRHRLRQRLRHLEDQFHPTRGGPLLRVCFHTFVVRAIITHIIFDAHSACNCPNILAALVRCTVLGPCTRNLAAHAFRFVASGPIKARTRRSGADRPYNADRPGCLTSHQMSLNALVSPWAASSDWAERLVRNQGGISRRFLNRTTT